MRIDMNSQRSIWTGLAAVALVAAAIMLLAPETGIAPAQSGTEQMIRNGATLSIEGVYENATVDLRADETVLGLLRRLDQSDPAVRLETKEYPGLGVLVVSIASTTNGTDNKYWQFKVNGEMPMVGAGDYKLKKGDRVEWFFAASEL